MITILSGDCKESMKSIESNSINCCVTSPPYYGLRDYNGGNLEIGTERTPEEYVINLLHVFHEVKRILRDDGTLWVNIADSYSFGSTPLHNSNTPNKNRDGSQDRTSETIGAALKPKRLQNSGIPAKNLIGIPWLLAFALRADGWYLRQDIIWHKTNPMPESVKDRCTKAHEYIFLLSKSAKYYFDSEAMQEPAKWERWGNQTENKQSQGNAGRLGNKTIAELPIKDTKNKRSVWTVTTKPYKGAHFATFPPDLIEPCILAGCPEGGTVIDPFGGSGTVAGVAVKHNRISVLCELNTEYHTLIRDRVLSISGYDMNTGTWL